MTRRDEPSVIAKEPKVCFQEPCWWEPRIAEEVLCVRWQNLITEERELTINASVRVLKKFQAVT